MNKRSLPLLLLLPLYTLSVSSLRTPSAVQNVIFQNATRNDATTVKEFDMMMVLELLEIQGQKIALLGEKLNSRDETVKRQEEMIRNLQKAIVEHSIKINELDSNFNKKNKVIERLENDVGMLEEKLIRYDKASNLPKKGQSDDLNISNEYPGMVKNMTDILETEHSKVLKECLRNKRDIRTDAGIRRTVRTTNQISFSAYLSKYTEKLGQYQTIKFDRVITNDGNAYNPLTGVFTVPVTGTYTFVFYVSSSEARVTFLLKANGQVQASGVARPDNIGQSNDVQGGGTVILRLNQGASVWVENRYNGGTVFSNLDYRWVTFSGFFLY